jgi:hypothetical protein
MYREGMQGCSLTVSPISEKRQDLCVTSQEKWIKPIGEVARSAKRHLEPWWSGSRYKAWAD